MLKKPVTLLASAALVSGSLLLAAPVSAVTPPAKAVKVKTCVNKKTGEMKYRKKGKKCKKGWKKVSWKKAGRKGAKGNTGPAGEKQQVLAADGQVVGRFVGTLFGGVPFYGVLRDGGLFFYLSTGQLIPTDQVVFRTDTCTGTPYATAGSGLDDFYAKLLAKTAGSQWRIVTRDSLDTLSGKARAFEYTGTVEQITDEQLYEDRDGQCQPWSQLETGFLVKLKEVPAPPDFTGPLRIS